MKNRLFITFVFIGVLWGSSAAWATFSDDKEYMVVFNKGISWEEAAVEAGVWGDSYHLATITSRQEQKYLQKLLRGLRGEFWIGGYQDAQNRWQWVTGEPWGYARWGKKEPNDFYGAGSEQHLAIWGKYHKHKWMWNDEGNLKNISGFIVERELRINDNGVVTPIPGAVWLLGSGLVVMMGIRLARRGGSNIGNLTRP